MKNPVLVVSSFIAGAVAFPVTVLAQGPTVNCAKASGEVETLICADPSLAALDRKLDEVYKAASAKAKGKLATRLREDQRGWVKGRNDCWKAKGEQTWITATWTVDTVKGVCRCPVQAPHVGTASGLATIAAEDRLPCLPEQPRQRGGGKLFRHRPGHDSTGARRSYRDDVARRICE